MSSGNGRADRIAGLTGNPLEVSRVFDAPEVFQGRSVDLVSVGMTATLRTPARPRGLVFCADAITSAVAAWELGGLTAGLNTDGFATLEFGLLTPAEATGARDIDIGLLSARIEAALRWARTERAFKAMPIGLFGVGAAGAASALAAAVAPDEVKALVARNGLLDLVAPALSLVVSPTLLLVDTDNRRAMRANERCLERLRGASHLIALSDTSGPGSDRVATDTATLYSRRWFTLYLMRSLH